MTVNLQESRNEKELYSGACALTELSGKASLAIVHECENRHLGFVASKDLNQRLLTAK
jgi:hypothetical protein